MRKGTKRPILKTSLSSYGTTDPLLGNSPEGENTFVIPREKSTPLVISHFPRLVITRGSVYTFLPSITSLRFIASLP